VEWLVAQGLVVAPSDANFVLFGRFDDREALWQQLLDRGVLVRVTGPEAGSGLDRDAAEMTAFKDALREVHR
jgi:histidinol-phosphate aminotransferase